MSTLTPTMSLVLPTIGVDSGLTWEQSVNTNSGILDGHNHSVGSGTQINPSGINVNTDFPFNGFNITALRSARFNAQMSPLSLPTDIGCIYVSGVDLYYNDIDGNQVRITSGGTVNATSSGISDGTATAAFSSGTLVVDSASNTPANIQGASILLGNTGVSGSNYITLSPPSALSSNYSLILPPLPAQTNVMTLDTSGNMSSITYDQVAQAMTSVGANAIQVTTTRSTGTSVGTGGVAVSGSSGIFNTTNTSTFVQVTNLSVTLVTSGRPVVIFLTGDTTGTPAFIGGAGNPEFQMQRNGTPFYIHSQTNTVLPPGVINCFDSQVAGTYTYSLFTKSFSAGQNASCQNCILIAYEL